MPSVHSSCFLFKSCYNFIENFLNQLQKGTVLDAGGSQASFLMQAFTLTKRSFVNMSRDFGYYWLRLVIYVVVTICIGTIYLNVGTGYNSILVLPFSARIIERVQILFICGETFEQFHSTTLIFYATGKRIMCIFCVWLCDIHVNWWISFLCGRYEGESFNILSNCGREIYQKGSNQH